MSSCLRYGTYHCELLFGLVVRAVSCLLREKAQLCQDSASKQINWHWKWHFLCVQLHPFLFMYMVPWKLLRYLLCQKWLHRVAYPDVAWLVSVQLSWKWVWCIIFLSISDGARVYSRCAEVMEQISQLCSAVAACCSCCGGRDGAHTQGLGSVLSRSVFSVWVSTALSWSQDCLPFGSFSLVEDALQPFLVLVPAESHSGWFLKWTVVHIYLGSSSCQKWIWVVD